MAKANEQGNISLQSICGESQEVTDALRLHVYVDELRRQSEIASRNLTRAWVRAMMPETGVKDTLVWGDLQSALFACIVIYRILKPGAIHGPPKETKDARQAQAERRGKELRALLNIKDDSPIFSVREVRNKFEHFDESLDRLIVADRASLVDWHISRDGTSFRTPEGQEGALVEALRVFYPGAGTLHFGNQFLDLFALDCALLTIRDELAPEAIKELRMVIQGPMAFGASQYIYLVERSVAEERLSEWLRVRSESGAPVPYFPAV